MENMCTTIHERRKSRIHDELRAGNFEVVVQLLKDGTPHDVLDHWLNSIAVLAAKAGNMEILRLVPRETLLLKNLVSETPLSISASKGNMAMLKWLIDVLDPSINAFVLENETLLTLACGKEGNKECVEYLLSIGCHVTLDEGYKSALTVACENGRVDVVELLAGSVNDDEISASFLVSVEKCELGSAKLLYAMRRSVIEASLEAEEVLIALDVASNGQDLFWLVDIACQIPSVKEQLRESREDWLKMSVNWTPALLEYVAGRLDVILDSSCFGLPYIEAMIGTRYDRCDMFHWLLKKQLLWPKRPADEVELVAAMAGFLRHGNVRLASLLDYHFPLYKNKMVIDPYWCTNLIQSVIWGGGHVLEWFWSLGENKDEDPVETLATWQQPATICIFPVSSVEWLIGRGWRCESDELRVASLNPLNWPTLCEIQMVIWLQYWDKKFEWKTSELEVEAIESELSYPSPDVDPLVSPLAWAIHHRYWMVVDWLIFDKKVRWTTLTSSETTIIKDPLSPAFVAYNVAFQDILSDKVAPSPYDSSYLPHGTIIRYLRNVARIPLPWVHKYASNSDIKPLFRRMALSRCVTLLPLLECVFDETMAQVMDYFSERWFCEATGVDDDDPSEYGYWLADILPRILSRLVAHAPGALQLHLFSNFAKRTYEAVFNCLHRYQSFVSRIPAEMNPWLSENDDDQEWPAQTSPVDDDCEEIEEQVLCGILEATFRRQTRIEERIALADWVMLQGRWFNPLYDMKRSLGASTYVALVMHGAGLTALKWMRRQGILITAYFWDTRPSESFLELSIRNALLPCVKYLVRCGDDPRKETQDGISCFELALRLGRQEIIDVLLESHVM